MINQTADKEIFPAAKKLDIGVVCMFAVRNALRSAADLRKILTTLIERDEISPAILEEAGVIKSILEEQPSFQLPDLAYRFCLANPYIHTVLSGTGNMKHLEANIASAAKPLPDPSTLEALKTALKSACSITGESFNQ
jgi:aryl-alcohol dehydrogenase-like predicted oxidoreductase